MITGLSSPLSKLVNTEGYQRRNPHVFAGPESVKWYIRKNREALATAGALLNIAGRHWIDADKFDVCVLQLSAARCQSN